MLTGTTSKLTPGDRAREPRSLAVVAWFDGWAQGAGSTAPREYPRPLVRHEADAWRAGWAEGRRQLVCGRWHGCTPCPGDHPLTLPESSCKTTDSAC